MHPTTEAGECGICGARGLLPLFEARDRNFRTTEQVSLSFTDAPPVVSRRRSPGPPIHSSPDSTPRHTLRRADSGLNTTAGRSCRRNARSSTFFSASARRANTTGRGSWGASSLWPCRTIAWRGGFCAGPPAGLLRARLRPWNRHSAAGAHLRWFPPIPGNAR